MRSAQQQNGDGDAVQSDEYDGDDAQLLALEATDARLSVGAGVDFVVSVPHTHPAHRSPSFVPSQTLKSLPCSHL